MNLIPSAAAPAAAEPAAPSRPPLDPRNLLKAPALALLLNVVCALVITLVNGGVNLVQNIVISMCIGTIVFLIVYPVRVLVWRDRRVTPLPFFAVMLAAIPVAQYLGSKLAGGMLGVDLVDLNSFGSGRMFAWMGFTLIAAVGAIVVFVSRDRLVRAEADAANERARAESTERQAILAQLQMLQAQIEPHMLFNTLANLQGLIAIDPARALHMLDQLIQYLRATLSSSRAQTTTLAQEFALMEAYLGLMKVRMGKRLAYTVDLPPALRDCLMAPMLLQPLVENAIMHGLEPKIDGGHVRVCAAQRDGALVVSVTDTGLGLGAASAKAGTHLGLANTRERLRAMFGDGASLTLDAHAAQGAIARLTLPFTSPGTSPLISPLISPLPTP